MINSAWIIYIFLSQCYSFKRSTKLVIRYRQYTSVSLAFQVPVCRVIRFNIEYTIHWFEEDMIEVLYVFIIIITTINYFFHAKLRFNASPILHFKAKFWPWMPFSRFSREEDGLWICSVSPDQKSEFFIQSFHFIISILFTILFSFQSYLFLKPHYFSLFWHPVVFFIILTPCDIYHFFW